MTQLLSSVTRAACVDLFNISRYEATSLEHHRESCSWDADIMRFHRARDISSMGKNERQMCRLRDQQTRKLYNSHSRRHSPHLNVLTMSEKMFFHFYFSLSFPRVFGLNCTHARSPHTWQPSSVCARGEKILQAPKIGTSPSFLIVRRPSYHIHIFHSKLHIESWELSAPQIREWNECRILLPCGFTSADRLVWSAWI